MARPVGVEGFVERFPRVFHVTDLRALPGIRVRGLLSAAALVDLYGVPTADRAALLELNRGKGCFPELPAPPGLPWAGLRDQWMPDAELLIGLRGAYEGQPAAWRRLINDHVFFCLCDQQARTLRKVNKARAQATLAFDARALLAAHNKRASTTPINTGIGRTRWGVVAARDENTFQPLSAFPRLDGRAPVELAIRGAVAAEVPFEVLPDD